MFYRSQKVVCVDAANTNSAGRVELIEGTIYTIDHVGPLSRGVYLAMLSLGLVWNSSLYISLIEVQRVRLPGLDEDIPFCASRFRPLVTRRTSIEVFERLAHGAPMRVTEDA